MVYPKCANALFMYWLIPQCIACDGKLYCMYAHNHENKLSDEPERAGILMFVFLFFV